MNYDDFAELDLFTEGPPSVIGASLVKLRFDLACMFTEKQYPDALAASLEYILTEIIQVCEIGHVPWNEVLDRAKARLNLETFFDDENI